ncbi:MAG: plastocyanin/azurin family copper-binding protein [Thermoproteota archaeon]|nr:plastocyanin/azurin family copper-binding protein [Thermoproteota archaeon]
MNSSKGSFFLIGLLISSTVFSSILLTVWTKPALGDGLTQEQLTASLGNRKADLLIKMIPPVVTTETLQNGQKPVVEFRLFDSNTNKSFSHVTYYIIIEKDGKRLLADLFHDHNGDLRIQINPSNLSQVSISGQQDPLLGAYIGTSYSPVIASGPIFINGGLYHFIVRIATVDSDSTLLPDNQEPIYDSWLSIGNTVNQQIDLNGKQIPIKVISYYDKLNSFRFDAKNMQMQFNMPFIWNVSRINKTNIFVHEEIYVPNPTPFTANKSFAGTVNGIDVSKDLMLDNSNPNRDVIHVMIPKKDLVGIADQVNRNTQASNGLMKFTLQPAKGSMSSMSGSNSSMSPAGAAGTNATSVSIVKGASNPNTQKPYSPSPLNVAVGRTVLWINNDNTAHTVTEGNPSGNTPSNGFDSGILSPGQTFKHAFDKPGTVGYFCSLHPFMLGQVMVK